MSRQGYVISIMHFYLSEFGIRYLAEIERRFSPE